MWLVMKRHILFDNNGVLTTSDHELTFKKTSKFLGVSEGEVERLFSGHVVDLDTGRISQDEFYARVLRDGKFDYSSKDLRKVHLSGYVRKPDVQQYAKSLKKKYEVYMLSNFGNAFWSLFGKWKLNEIFPKERVFVSADLGIAKPSKKIYLEVLKKLDAAPECVVFIDDNLENVRSARSVGISGIQFKNLDELKRELGKLGIKV